MYLFKRLHLTINHLMKH